MAPSTLTTGPPHESPHQAPPAHGKSPPRRHDLDWLRVFAVLGLIPFHVAVIFSAGSDYVHNAQRSPLLVSLIDFVTFWGIPLLFLVAGASAWFALGRRTPGQYVRERVLRLVVPLVFGVVAIVPVQVYFGRLSNPRFHQSYLEFYPQFLASFTLARAPEYIGHLWFVPNLLLYALVTLPLFLYLRGTAGQRIVAHIAAFCERLGMIFLFSVPMGVSETLFRSSATQSLTSAYIEFTNLAFFSVFLLAFVYGYLIYAQDGFGRAIERHALAALGLGILCWWVVAQLGGIRGDPGHGWGIEYVAVMFLRGLVTWCWIVAIVGLAMRFLNHGSPILDYLNEAFYPVYVLHMPVLTIVGFYVVRWPMAVWPKYLIILLATCAVTMALYHVLIRRNPVLRPLFGLRMRPPTSRKRANQNEAGHPLPDAKL